MAVVNFPTSDAADCELPLELEPALEVEPEDEIALEPTQAAPVAAMALVEILPADFQLPLLTKFIPNRALQTAVDECATQALSIEVVGTDGLQRADASLAAVRGAIKAIDEHFADPVRIANDLHKRLTGIRGEWQLPGKAAIETMGRRIYAEQQRLQRLADEERRRQQAEADRLAREAAQREAEAAAQSSAPVEVVQELKRQAETVTAPPVAAPPPPGAAMSHSTTVKTWKARIAGTPGSDEPNPTMDALSVAQRHQVIESMKAVIEGRAPLTVFELNWSYLNARAKADKSAMAITGLESFEQGSVRAKATRSTR